MSFPNEMAGEGKRQPRYLGQRDFSREFFLSDISILEIELGALALQIARRDAAQGAVLRAWIDDQILPRFDGRASSPSIRPWRSVARIFTFLICPCGTRCFDRSDGACSMV